MNKKQIIEMLRGLALPDDELFGAARAVRAKVFQERVVVRGVIELTNKCRVNCTFCAMRRDNMAVNSTYMLDALAVVARAKAIRDAGINVVSIQGGELPQTTDVLECAIPQVLDAFNGRAEVLLNLGNKPRSEFERLRRAGAHSYILKHETSDALFYERLKFEPLSERLQCLEHLKDLGFIVGTGSIVGLPGQSVEHVADDILFAKNLDVRMVSASPFVPALNTPLEKNKPGSVLLTLRAIAVMRLMMPNILIPSVTALEAIEPGAQGMGLRAGANVITANFTPANRKHDYLIYGSKRYVAELDYVQELLKANGLRMSSSHWVEGPAATHDQPG